jgi:hypothetical protein
MEVEAEEDELLVDVQQAFPEQVSTDWINIVDISEYFPG